jgi:hypothetical protein
MRSGVRVFWRLEKKEEMRRFVLLSLLALGTAIGGSAASGAPATTGFGVLSQNQSGTQLVRDGHRGHYNRHNYRRHHYRGYNRNWRHNRYRGWHRYHHRPSNWRSRGCVIVGPIWFCP